jgi:hypothetical protein
VDEHPDARALRSDHEARVRATRGEPRQHALGELDREPRPVGDHATDAGRRVVPRLEARQAVGVVDDTLHDASRLVRQGQHGAHHVRHDEVASQRPAGIPKVRRHQRVVAVGVVVPRQKLRAVRDVPLL